MALKNNDVKRITRLKDYGDSIYEAPTLYNGVIKGDDIEWQKC